MTEFGNSIGLDLASREVVSSRAALLPENFGAELELPAASRRELSSIRAETDPELLGAALLSWAAREERAERFASATLAYRFVSEDPSQLGFNSSDRSRAEERMALFVGGGSAGARAEYQLSRFVSGATDPAFLAAMATGSAVFSVARAGLLARFAMSGRAALGAEALASAGAFGVEVPSVWITAKGITEMLAPGSQSWSAEANLHELAGLGLTLGAMKFCGAAIGRASRVTGSAAPTLSAAWSQRALTSTAALTGIALGRQLEVAVGIRPQSDTTSLVIDSLALFLQVQVGSRVAQRALGPGFQAQSQSLDILARQSETLAWQNLGSRWNGRAILRGQGPDMIRPASVGQGPDMIRPALFGQGPDMIRPASLGQGPDMIRPAFFGQGPDMIRPASVGQGPDMIRPALGQGPDMRAALQ